MKRVITAAAVGMLAGSALTAFAGGSKFPHHPNLQKAYNQLQTASQRIADAQKANEFDLGGHAAKAKELTDQAVAELDQAAASANENRR